MLGLLASALLFVLSSAEEDVIDISGGDLLDRWLADVKEMALLLVFSPAEEDVIDISGASLIDQWLAETRQMIERDENMKEGIDKAIEYRRETEYFTTDYFILAGAQSNEVTPGYHSCPIYLPTSDNSGRVRSKVVFNCTMFYELSSSLRKTGRRQVYIEKGKFEGWYIQAEISIITGDVFRFLRQLVFQVAQIRGAGSGYGAGSM